MKRKIVVIVSGLILIGVLAAGAYTAVRLLAKPEPETAVAPGARVLQSVVDAGSAVTASLPTWWYMDPCPAFRAKEVVMIPVSLRWRLPLTYAAIALIATLSLGIVMVALLRDLYRQQELHYLARNALAVSEEITVLLQAEPPLTGPLQAQVKGFAFLTQTRIKVLDNAGNLYADSGDPATADTNTRIAIDVTVADVGEAFSHSIRRENGAENTSYTSFIVIEDGSARHNVERTVLFTGLPADSPEAMFPVSHLPAMGTLFGFDLASSGQPDSGRSNLIVRHPIWGPGGRTIGIIELSQGPAYGRRILHSVTIGWALASGVAIVVAGMVGWLISRRLTTPLLGLAATTRQMAGGDLSARSGVSRQDELGLLADGFNQMAARIEETVATLRHFVADAAHELHTPLTALQTDLELVAQAAAPGEMARLGRAQQQVTRLQKLTSDLLDLSRLETETAVIQHTLLDLNKLVQSGCEPYASRAEQASVDFRLILSDEPLLVRGDERQLGRALGNLLDNALKFTPGGGQVEVRLQLNDRWAGIAIADTGIGFQAAERTHLSRRFYRGRNASAYPGSGLGLAIVQAIVTAHEGQLHFESRDTGSLFLLQLPTTGNTTLKRG